MNNLDDIKVRENLDKMLVGKALELYLEQMENTWQQVQKASLPIFKPSALIFSGMGGSGLAGRIVSGVYEKKVSFPMVVYADYGLPAWVNENCLVVANSYSGNTEETLSAIEEAKKVKARILGISTGGKLATMIKNQEFPGVIIQPSANPPGFPKTGHGISFAALLGVLSKTEVIPLSVSEFLLTLDSLGKLRGDWLPDVPFKNNPAKKLASEIIGKIPLLFSSRPLLGSIHASTNVLHEIGRTFTVYFDFPEFNHHLVEAFEFPNDIKRKVECLFVHSEFFSDRVKLRYEVVDKLFQEKGLKISHYYLKGKDILTQAFEQQHFFAWVAYYSSLLQNSDPGPEEWIIKLKKLLEQPVH